MRKRAGCEGMCQVIGDKIFFARHLCHIIPYVPCNGMFRGLAFVNVGTSHDTSEFAVESISRWWETTVDKVTKVFPCI
jgi:hypothetical protein